ITMSVPMMGFPCLSVASTSTPPIGVPDGSEGTGQRTTPECNFARSNGRTQSIPQRLGAPIGLVQGIGVTNDLRIVIARQATEQIHRNVLACVLAISPRIAHRLHISKRVWGNTSPLKSRRAKIQPRRVAIKCWMQQPIDEDHV